MLGENRAAHSSGLRRGLKLEGAPVAPVIGWAKPRLREKDCEPDRAKRDYPWKERKRGIGPQNHEYRLKTTVSIPLGNHVDANIHDTHAARARGRWPPDEGAALDAGRARFPVRSLVELGWFRLKGRASRVEAGVSRAESSDGETKRTPELAEKAR